MSGGSIRGLNPAQPMLVARAAMHLLIGRPNISMAYFLPAKADPHGATRPGGGRRAAVPCQQRQHIVMSRNIEMNGLRADRLKAIARSIVYGAKMRKSS